VEGSQNNRRRVLAIDPGERRIGLAVSDELGITAQGMDTYEMRGREELLAHLGALIEEHSIGTVVVGEPRSLAGGEIEGTGRARELAGTIRERFGTAVVLIDERMTSREAERALAAGERRHGKKDIDKLAAVLLLQSFLDGRSER
jgi:putative Holliday junction resolvase